MCLLSSCLGSMGAITALKEVETESDWYKLIRPWNFWKYRGFLVPQGLHDWLHSRLDNREMAIPFFIATYNLKKGELLVVSSEEHSTSEMIDWTLASMTVPVVIHPMKSDFFDGWLKRSILFEPLISTTNNLHIILSQPSNLDNSGVSEKKMLGLLGPTIQAITYDNVADDLKSLGHAYDGEMTLHYPKELLLDYRDYNGEKMSEAFNDGYNSLADRL